MASASRYAAAHDNPNGPGDARPTALQVIEDEGLANKLTDKVFLITGCSSGIGVETARALYATGAHLFLTVRDMEKGKEAVKKVTESDKDSKGRIDLIKLELDSLQLVREAAADFLSKSKKLNVLINNAAYPAGLFHTFISSRVVALSSSAHRSSNIHFDDLDLKKLGYDPWVAYGQSKTANILFANEIERRYISKDLHATSVHPGGIMTDLGRHLDPERFKAMMTPEIHLKMKSPEQGAATTVWAAVAKEWEGKGGRYLEDCQEAGPKKEGDMGGLSKGYLPYAYDEEAAKKLWALSLKLVGMQEDE